MNQRTNDNTFGPWGFVVNPWDTSRGQSTWPIWNPFLMGQTECGGSGRLSNFSNFAGRVGSGQQHFKSRGSGRVGSRGSQTFAGQVGSGRDMSKLRGLGRVRWPDQTRPVRFDLTHEKPCLYKYSSWVFSIIFNFHLDRERRFLHEFCVEMLVLWSVRGYVGEIESEKNLTR